MKKYKDHYDELLISNDKYRQTYSMIPPDILSARLKLYLAEFKNISKKYSDACKMYTEIIKMGQRYEPWLRKRCLLRLSEIFRSLGIFKDEDEKRRLQQQEEQQSPQKKR